MALIGGGHEVGAAHAKCSGYVGAWTSDPLTWTNEFFPDLMQDDWTWYEACSYENGTTEYMKMESPFAEGADESGEGSSHGNHHHKRRLGGDDEEEEADVCAVAQCGSASRCARSRRWRSGRRDSVRDRAVDATSLRTGAIRDDARGVRARL